MVAAYFDGQQWMHAECCYIRYASGGACGAPAKWIVKVMCAHEHLYDSLVCEEHKDAEILGCYDCTRSAEPHMRCPAQTTEHSELVTFDPFEGMTVQHLDLGVTREEIAGRVRSLSDILTDAIPPPSFDITEPNPKLDLKAIRDTIQRMQGGGA